MAIVVALMATGLQSSTIDHLAVAILPARIGQTLTHIHQPTLWVLLHSVGVHDLN
jgi:hypothetical protein